MAAPANDFLASLERASLSSPPKPPAPKPERQPSAGDFLAGLAKSPAGLPHQSNADDFLAGLSPPAARAQPRVQPAAGNFLPAAAAPPAGAPPPLASTGSAAADFLAAGAPSPLASTGSAADLLAGAPLPLASTGSAAADFLASTNPAPNPTLARGTSAADFLASTDGQRQAAGHDPATLEQAQRAAQRAVLFWSGGLCRTVFRGWQLATLLGRQARQAGRQVCELYVCVEAVRFEAPQLEWLHEERITRLFLELHPLVTARQPAQATLSPPHHRLGYTQSAPPSPLGPAAPEPH